jgi:hypothetical protein
MADDANIYSLIMSATEPDAQQKAATLAALLRRQQTAGQLMQMHPLMAKMGASMLQSAGQQQGQLGEAGQTRYGGALKRDLQDDEQAATVDLLGKKQGFEGEQNGLDRAARAREGVLNRALAREKAKADAAAPSGPKPLDFKDISGLRKEFNDLPAVKNFGQVSGAYQKIQKAAANPSPAGDLNLIFGYMKLLDPGSTVREGEFANAQNAGGIDSKIANLYNQALQGTRLSPEQRADFMQQAQDLYGVHEGQFREATTRYSAYAKKYGVDPGEVVDLGSMPEAPAKSAQPTASGPAVVEERALPDGRTIQLLSDGSKRIKG